MRKFCLLMLLFASLLPFYAQAELEIRFLDVGDADAALIQCDGHAMLIDGGNKSDSSMMYTILQQAEIDHLDIVVATHAHADHIGGIPGALNRATAGLVLCPVDEGDDDAFADFAKYAKSRSGGITVPAPGDTYPLGDAHITILGVNTAEGVNNSSIVLRLTYGEVSFLFTGDAEADAEWALVDSGTDLSADILKVAHHGSDTGTTQAFLNAVQPTFAVISVAQDSDTGNPSSAVLQRLHDMQTVVYRTDRHKNITFSTDGTFICVTIEKSRFRFINGPTDDSVSMEDVSYIVNTSSCKFHRTDCRHVSRIKGKNYAAYYGTQEDLLRFGYEPCQVCSP